MKPVGYACLIDRYDLAGPRPWHCSTVGRGGRSAVVTADGVDTHYPLKYDPGPGTLDHLVFALKFDGVDLRVLKAVFHVLDERELVDALRESPLSAPLRRLWFLYEWLLRTPLPVPDLKTGNYIDLLEPERYVTAPLFRSPRQRIVMNALGTSLYCPMVRNTPQLQRYAGKELSRAAGRLMQTVEPTVLARATSYLYLKESQTSWDIERVAPTQNRMARFLAVLRHGGAPAITSQAVIAAHNAIVDPDNIETHYRREQVYVADGRRIDYIAPKPRDVDALMDGLLGGVDHNDGSQAVIETDIAAMNGGRGRGTILRTGMTIDPVVHAAIVGFGFVYIHPFADGNGRMHRYLIQQVLARRQFAPPDVIIPVSPAILRDRTGYLQALDAVSKHLLPHVHYSQDPRTGQVTVTNDTADLYRYPDLTVASEYLYAKIEDAIERDVHAELVYLQTYDRAQLRVRLVRQLPDHQEQAALRLCFAEGRLDPEMRTRHFPGVSNQDLDAIEQTVQQVIRDCPLPQEFMRAQAIDQAR
jgi:hypothetical protein